MKLIMFAALKADINVEVLGPGNIKVELVGPSFASTVFPNLFLDSAVPSPSIMKAVIAAANQALSDAYSAQAKLDADSITAEVVEQFNKEPVKA